jgi:hypothetical protein
MNEVERIFRNRDQRIDCGELIGIILTEEEHKKHQKEGTLPIYQRIETGPMAGYDLQQVVSSSPVKRDFVVEGSYQDVIKSGSNNNKSSRKKTGNHELEITADDPGFKVHPEMRGGKQRFCLCLR